MKKEHNKYEWLIQQGVSRETLNVVLHKLIMLEKQGKLSRPSAFSNKVKRKLLVISGKALSLLKSQFAKKPKNPV